jgi:hypothetical protein
VEIHTQCVCKVLLVYLLAYSNTLEALKIEDTGRAYSNLELAADLKGVLSQHSLSLRELSIWTTRDQGWALGVSNKDLLMVPLPVLETLTVSVFMGSKKEGEGDDYLVSSEPFVLVNHLNVVITRKFAWIKYLTAPTFPSYADFILTQWWTPAKSRGS